MREAAGRALVAFTIRWSSPRVHIAAITFPHIPWDTRDRIELPGHTSRATVIGKTNMTHLYYNLRLTCFGLYKSD
jgi:hypothetical protein